MPLAELTWGAGAIAIGVVLGGATTVGAVTAGVLGTDGSGKTGIVTTLTGKKYEGLVEFRGFKGFKGLQPTYEVTYAS